MGKVSYRADVAPLDSPPSEGLGEVPEGLGEVPEGLGKVSYRADVAPLDSPPSEGMGEVLPSFGGAEGRSLGCEFFNLTVISVAVVHV